MHFSKTSFFQILYLLSLTTLWASSTAASAQENNEPLPLSPIYHFRHYTINDGLPSNSISDITQDPQGFIWIATPDGAARFDGYQFVTHQTGNEEENGRINSNEVNEIHVDDTGQLWFGTRAGGTNSFAPTTQTFAPYPDTNRFELTRPDQTETDSPPPGPLGLRLDVLALTVDQQGNHWWGSTSRTGLAFFDAETEQGEVIAPDLYAGDAPIFELLTADDGSIWIFAVGGVTRWLPETDTFIPQITLENASPDIRPVAIQDQNGDIWFSFAEKFYRYDQPSDTVIEVPTNLPTIQGIAQDSTAIFWLGTADGLYTFDPITAAVQQVTPDDPNLTPGLADTNIRHVFADREDNIWLGTSRGISLLPRRHLRFDNYTTRISSNLSTLPEGSISAVTGQTDTDTVWLSIENQLVQLEDKRFTAHPLPTNSDETISEITYLEASQKGGVWVGTQQNTLFYFDPATAVFTPIPLTPPNNLPPNAAINGMTETADGDLWLTIFRNSLRHIDGDTGAETVYGWPGPPDLPVDGRTDDPFGINQGDGVATLIVNDGQLWIGRRDGSLEQIDLVNGELLKTIKIEQNPDFVTDIHETADGNTIWLTTIRELIRYDIDRSRSQTFNRENRYPTLISYRIEEDSFGRLWVSTHNGLIEIDPETSTFTPHYAQDGLLSASFAPEASWQTTDGRLYFGTSDGLITFDPRDITADSAPPTVFLTELRLFNEPVTADTWSIFTGAPLLSQAIEFAPSIQLDHTEDLISFEFSSLSFGTPENNRYRYRLAGLENDWYEVGSDRRYATYTDLRGGTYTFEVQGSNADGVWSETATSLEIIVSPPWWETWWFRTAMVFAFLAFTGIAVQWRLYNTERRNRELETEVARQTAVIRNNEEQKRRLAVLEERQRIGRELHDDIGQVIGYVNVQTQTALNRLRQNENQQVEVTLQQLMRVAQDAHTDIRQYILGIREEKEDAPETFVDQLKSYLKHIKELYDLDVQLSIPPNWSESPFPHDTETQLLRIIQESLTNTRKHAQVDHAFVLFTELDEMVQLVISDEGQGFTVADKAQQKRNPLGEEGNATAHFGLTIMEERAESFGGRLEIRSAPDQGTQIIVQIPKQLETDPESAVAGLRILLVDDHRLYAEGIANLLRTRGVQIVGMAENGLVAQEMAAELQPDLILMDVDMPVCDGLEATKQIKEKFPHIKIVMLTVAADEEKLYTALQIGASGYLLKSVRSQEFFQMLRDAMLGENALPIELAARLLKSVVNESPIKIKSTPEKAEPADENNETADSQIEPLVLTFRQQQVLELVVQGMSNREIAAQLFITPHTVKQHVSRILKYYQLKSRYELNRSHLGPTSPDNQ